MTKLHIKNMVCPRCIMAVKGIFAELKIDTISITLGEVELNKPLSKREEQDIKVRLAEIGFELLENNEKIMVEQIKSVLINHLESDDRQNVNFSELLSSSLLRDYSSLSKLFSMIEGITIEQYIIDLRIEKVKELLSYGEKTLSQIAFDLGYSSVAHLSAQFKKTTGITPTQFKKDSNRQRKGLDII